MKCLRSIQKPRPTANMLADLYNTDAEILFKAARKKAANFKTIASAAAIITNACTMKPACAYCWFQSRFIKNFKLSQETLIARIQAAEKAGLDWLHLGSGWMGQKIPSSYMDYIRLIKEHSTLKVWGCFGTLNKASLRELKAAGMDGYLCNFETANEALFQKVKPGDNFKDRLQTLKDTKALGMELWTGFIYGLGESKEDLFKSLEWFKDYEADALLISRFTPCPYTSLEKELPPSPYQAAKIVAMSRILTDNAQVFGDSTWGLRAGANGFLVSQEEDIKGSGAWNELRKLLYARDLV